MMEKKNSFQSPLIPPAVAEQLGRLTGFLCEHEQDNLVGVYLHGSLAMGGFRLGSSDLDLLVLLAEPAPARCMAWAELLLQLSGDPAPIEISFLHRSQYHPWRYPTPYDFHYSEDWRSKLANELVTGEWRHWNSAAQTDVDLAAHFTVARRRGLRLVGEGVAALPVVPWADYMDSITRDIAWASERAVENPAYLVLNACRVWAASREQLVLSKAEGAAWAQPLLPSNLAATVAVAAALYGGKTSTTEAGILTPAAALQVAGWISRQLQHE